MCVRKLDDMFENDMDYKDYHFKKLEDPVERYPDWWDDTHRRVEGNWKSQYKVNKQHNIHNKGKSDDTIRKMEFDEFSDDDELLLLLFWFFFNVSATEIALFDGTAKTVVFTEVFRNFEGRENIEQVRLDFGCDILPQMMEYLYEHKVQRLLVEGGTALLQSFIDNGLWDEAFVEEAPFELGSGVKAPNIGNELRKEKNESFGRWISHFLH